jgi:F0F1-type ATP synthase membrane subunit b/b'
MATDAGRRITADAKRDAESIIARANASVEAEWQRTHTEMRTAIIDVSAVMAEKFVKLAVNKETHDKLFEETISDLEDMSWRS